jgi:hypothetical protein
LGTLKADCVGTFVGKSASTTFISTGQAFIGRSPPGVKSLSSNFFDFSRFDRGNLCGRGPEKAG